MTVEKTRRVVVVRSVDTLLYEYRCIFMTTNYLLQVGQAVHGFKDSSCCRRQIGRHPKFRIALLTR